MSRRFLLIGDVGGAETYHVGDEGMLEANLLRLRQLFPQAQFTVISQEPAWTAKTYGVDAIEPIGFPDASAGAGVSDWRLEVLLGAATSRDLPADFERREQALEVVAAVDEAEGVIVSGGGNLNSTWPEHLYERLALVGLAEKLDTRALVLGQTVGPELTGMQRQRLSEILSGASLMGARETGTYQLLENLDIPAESLHYQLDDAVFLGREGDTDAIRSELERPFLAVTLCGEIEGIEGLARQIARLASTMDADVVFIPHAKEPDRDRELGERFGEALEEGSRFHLLDVLPAVEVAALTGVAEMVISARYHPLVFGAAGGVPCLGLSSDTYTRQKLTGALAHAGLEDWVLPIDLAASGLLIKAASEAWERRQEIRDHLGGVMPAWEARFEAHWRLVGVRLGKKAGEGGAPTVGTVDEPARLRPDGEWFEAARTYARVVAERESELTETRLHAEELKDVVWSREQEIASLRPVLESYESEVGSIRQVLDKTQEEVESLRETLQAREEELTQVKPTLAAKEEELEAIKPTLAAKEEELEAIKPTLAAKKKELESIKPTLEAKKKELESIKPSLAAKEKELESIKPTLDAKEKELDSIKPTLEAREREIESLKPTLEAREKELMSIKPVLEAREEELEETRQSLEELREELADCESTLTAYRTSFVGKVARRLGQAPEVKKKDS